MTAPANSPGGIARAVEQARGLLHRAEIHRILDHWAALAGDGWPTRKALDPMAMGASLSLVWLMDYDSATRRFRYRLAGDSVRDNYETSLVGRHLDETIPPEDYAPIGAYFERCVLEPCIVVFSGRLYQERDRPGRGERVIMPLFQEDGRAVGVLGATYIEHVFGSRDEAFHTVDRLSAFIPLDGGAADITRV